jgi:ankyrin repeat protein
MEKIKKLSYLFLFLVFSSLNISWANGERGKKVEIANEVSFNIMRFIKQSCRTPEEFLKTLCNWAQAFQFGTPVERSWARGLVFHISELPIQSKFSFDDIILTICDVILKDNVVLRYTRDKDLCRQHKNIGCLLCMFLRELRKKGISVYTPNKDGKNVLEVILERKHAKQDMVKLLLAHFPDVNSHKRRAREFSLCDQTNRKQLPPLTVAIKSWQSCAVLQDIIDAGHEINYGDKNFDPPLIEAVKMDNRKAFDLLLKNDADVNIRDKHGKTALHWAIIEDKEEIFDRLLEIEGVDFSEDFKGNTGLHFLAQNNDFFGVQSFVEDYGADPDIENKKGLLPVHLTTDSKIKKFLLSHMKREDVKVSFQPQKTGLLGRIRCILSSLVPRVYPSC